MLNNEKDINPFQKDYYIKQFMDSMIYGNGSKYKNKSDNFAYVRCENTDNKIPTILENFLIFFIRYPEFRQRTGIGLIEFLSMDPSTSDQIQNSWSELMKPEEKKNEEIAELQKQLQDFQKQLYKQQNKKK